MTITMGHNSDYMTRDGRDVRILAVDGNHVVEGIAYPIIAVSTNGVPYSFTADGKIFPFNDDYDDIIERPPKFRHEWWVNVYPGPFGHILYHSKALADAEAIRERIACVKIVIEGTYGEGL